MLTEIERKVTRLANQNAAVARKRALIVEARQKPCADCGLAEPRIMDLDHVPERGPKLFSLGAALSGGRGGYHSKKEILAELAKCDTVCPNCHRRRTNTRSAVR